MSATDTPQPVQPTPPPVAAVPAPPVALAYAPRHALPIWAWVLILVATAIVFFGGGVATGVVGTLFHGARVTHSIIQPGGGKGFGGFGGGHVPFPGYNNGSGGTGFGGGFGHPGHGTGGGTTVVPPNPGTTPAPGANS